jgi:hypothetical protein
MIVAATPMRPLLALADFSPHLRVRIPRLLGLTKSMRAEATMMGNGAEAQRANEGERTAVE